VQTADLVTGDRFEFWRHAVATTFVPLRCDPSADYAPAAFSGRIRSLQLGAVQISEITATPDLVHRTSRPISRSDGDFFKVNLQMDGSCLLTQDGRVAPLNPGDFAIYDTTRPYAMRLGRAYRTLVLVIPQDRLRTPPERVARLTARAMSGRDGVGALLSPFLARFAERLGQFDNAAGLRVADTIVDLVDTLLTEHLGAAEPTAESGRRLLLTRILAYIEEHLGDPDLGPERIAAAHYISTRYLHKLLHDEGRTVAGWVRTRRLERCRRDLGDPLLADQPVSAIGARWGFTDAAHFSRVLRAAFGSSPREYRATASWNPCPAKRRRTRHP
jgi:AraC-like DNA-binding protein